MIVGLTGGIACGKSFVAAALKELGAHIVEADDLGRELLSTPGPCQDAVIKEFGTAERPQLAAKVFNNPAALAKLNAIIHPGVRERALQQFAAIHAQDPQAIIIYIAAILFESGAVHETGKVIVVTCTRAQQIERALQRAGATLADIEARIARQMPLEEKAAQADYLIDASHTKEETLRQTKIVFEELKALA